MSDGITDAYRHVVTTVFSSKRELRCTECGELSRDQTSWWDGKYHAACTGCAQRAGVI